MTGPAKWQADIASNIRAERARANLGQAQVVDGMRALGFDAWRRQTLGSIERGHRRVFAAEVIGLAWVLKTNISTLMSAVG